MNRIRTPAVAVSSMFFLNGGLFGAWASRVPSIKAGFDLSPDHLGLLLLMLAAGGIVSFPVAGEMVSRHGAARITRLLAVGYCAALVLLGAAPAVWALAVALFLFGVGHGAMDVAMNAWGAEVEKAGKRALMPFFHAMWSLGAGAAALASAGVIKIGLGILPHFLIFAVAIGAAALLLAAVEWVSETDAVRRRGPLIALPKGALLLVGVVIFAATLGEGAMADWSGVFLVETLGATEGAAPLGYAVFATAMVATRLSGGFIVARLGAVGATRGSGVLASIGFLLAVFGGALPVVLAGFALVGLGSALIFPLAMTRAANDGSEAPGRAIAAMATCGYGGILLGPPVIGFIAERTSYEASFLLLAALAALVALLAASLRPGR
jgi:MFS family permease